MKWMIALLMLSSPALAQQVPMSQSRDPTKADVGGGSGAISGAIDPTKNVLDLVGALKEMLKELRVSDKELFESKLKGERDIGEQRSRYEQQILKQSTDRVSAEAVLRASFDERYAITEKGRVDAILLAIKNAADVATAQAQSTATGLAKAVADTATTLSTQQARQAEDVRKLVETTAQETNRTVNQRFADTQTQFTGIGSRLTALEQAGAEGKGSARFQDPALAALVAEVRTMSAARSNQEGVGSGRGDVVGWIFGGVAALVAFASFIVNWNRRPAP